MPDAAETYEHEPMREMNAEAGTAPEPEPGELTADEQSQLLALRQRITDGEVHEWTGDYKRLRFTRWLYEQGRMQS